MKKEVIMTHNFGFVGIKDRSIECIEDEQRLDHLETFTNENVVDNEGHYILYIWFP